jgi:hypothetical protein
MIFLIPPGTPLSFPRPTRDSYTMGDGEGGKRGGGGFGGGGGGKRGKWRGAVSNPPSLVVFDCKNNFAKIAPPPLQSLFGTLSPAFSCYHLQNDPPAS